MYMHVFVRWVILAYSSFGSLYCSRNFLNSFKSVCTIYLQDITFWCFCLSHAILVTIESLLSDCLSFLLSNIMFPQFLSFSITATNNIHQALPLKTVKSIRQARYIIFMQNNMKLQIYYPIKNSVFRLCYGKDWYCEQTAVWILCSFYCIKMVAGICTGSRASCLIVLTFLYYLSCKCL